MIETLCDAGNIKSLEYVWNNLASRFQNPLLRYEWFAACAEAFCPSSRLAVVAVRSRGEIAAIAPLTQVRRGGVDTLELLGSSFLNEPSGFIYRDAESLAELVLAVIKMRKPVLLRRLSADCPELGALKNACRGRAFCTIRNSSGSPFIPITTDWAAFSNSISARRRSDLRRAQRRAEALGNVRFEILSPEPQQVESYLDEILRVEAAGWKGYLGTAIMFDERIKRFFHLYSRSAARLGMLRLCFMRIDGKAVAVQAGVEHSDRFWVLKIGYDEAWSRCSPGMLLTHETIRHVFERGLKAYEFLGSDQPWLRVWSKQVHPHVSLRIYPFSLEAALGLGVHMSEYLANRVLLMGER